MSEPIKTMQAEGPLPPALVSARKEYDRKVATITNTELHRLRKASNDATKALASQEHRISQSEDYIALLEERVRELEDVIDKMRAAWAKKFNGGDK